MTVSLLIETGIGHVFREVTNSTGYFGMHTIHKPDTIVTRTSRCLMERGDVSSSTNVKKNAKKKKDVRLN